MTRLLLVRHGQTRWNRVERFRGRADIPLDETGLAQADALGLRISRTWRVRTILTSPLSRARQTALAVARHTGASVRDYSDLVDIDFGEWQGLTPGEVRERWPGPLADWYESPGGAHIPGGEPFERVRQRCRRVIREARLNHDGETLVLVGHTVVNRAFILAALGLHSRYFWSFGQETCALNVIELSEDGRAVLVAVNDTCHLR